MKIYLMLLTFILTMAASVFAQSGDRDAKIKSEVEKVLTEQTAAWNAGNIENFMKGYWNSPDLIFVSGDNVTRGWQPTIDRYRKNYDSRAKMGTLTFSGLQIDVLSKDSAVVLGSWSLAREADNPHGKFTLIFRKFKDGWRIIHDHTS